MSEPGAGSDGSNLASLELVARQLQLCEERYKDELLSSRGSGAGGDEHFFFTGVQSTRGIMVAPTLSEWIAKQLSAESAIAKERRKACEEQQLLHPPAGGGGLGLPLSICGVVATALQVERRRDQPAFEYVKALAGRSRSAAAVAAASRSRRRQCHAAA